MRDSIDYIFVEAYLAPDFSPASAKQQCFRVCNFVLKITAHFMSFLPLEAIM